MSPHSWNRREFTVTQAGYFTVLKPTGWFSAARLAGGFRYALGKPKKAEPPAATPAPELDAPNHPDSQEAPISLQIVSPSEGELHLVRLVLIVLAAAAITLGVLWWMTPNNPWRHY